jgi:hypothetical protein
MLHPETVNDPAEGHHVPLMECSRPFYKNRPPGSAVIKPGNLWLKSNGVAQIGDFGPAVALRPVPSVN